MKKQQTRTPHHHHHHQARIRLYLPVLSVVLLSGCLGSAPPSTNPPLPAQQIQYPLDLFPAPVESAEATIKRVVDGDTVVVEFSNGREENVRLIGIDTPEVPGGYRPAECYGTESSSFMTEALPVGSRVLLTAGEEPYDLYERLLAYVYRQDGVFVNMLMAREGYADDLPIPPNNEYAQYFAEAVRLARKEKLGMWGACDGSGGDSLSG